MFPYSDADVHHGSFPYTNVVLIGLCCLMFLYLLAVGGVGFLTGGGGVEAQVFFLKWGFIPEELIRSHPQHRDAATHVGAHVSSMFMHGGFCTSPGI